MRTTLLVFGIGITLLTLPLNASASSGFADVPDNHPSVVAITAFSQEKIIKGHADGMFRPDTPINRAELLALSYRVKGLSNPYKPSIRCFLDVLPIAWYAPYVCAAKDAKIIAGYSDRKFHGERQVTVAEATKIIAMIHGLIAQPPLSGEVWHKPYMDILMQNKYLPPSIRSAGQRMTRGEASEILWRIRNQRRDLPGVALSDLQTEQCQLLVHHSTSLVY